MLCLIPLQVAFRPYLSQQFSIAYDVYLAIRRQTDERVMNALGRDSQWRLKHACPACMYKLEGEDQLIFDLLTTMDGNDSLKRVLRRLRVQDEGDGDPTLGKSKERPDNRDAGDGYFLSRERVDTWAKTRLAETLPMEANSVSISALKCCGLTYRVCRLKTTTPAPTDGKI